ncbi:hypothetical protein MKQ70_32390 [Chitinophaga sedimenti]|uniref:hypothetical protein n=1 Tax=Chitinophaga sedimenti TaxID=2033606 RepID=UPI002005C879|nr:hypothetical protein [Chitinophaga sedimenti]MCK7559417.1 hypothetical protein [Chitinophaga sedimenti]
MDTNQNYLLYVKYAPVFDLTIHDHPTNLAQPFPTLENAMCAAMALSMHQFSKAVAAAAGYLFYVERMNILDLKTGQQLVSLYDDGGTKEPLHYIYLVAEQGFDHNRLKMPIVRRDNIDIPGFLPILYYTDKDPTIQVTRDLLKFWIISMVC